MPTVIFPGDPGSFEARYGGESGKNISAKGNDDGTSDVAEARRNKRKELDGYFKDVKQLSSTTFVGLAKKKRKDDVLTRLGVAAPTQQTMPLRMALGIKAGREKRTKKAMEQAKESGVIHSSSTKSSSQEEGRRRKSFDTGKGDTGGIDGISSRNGIMRLSKKKLSPRLFQGGDKRSDRKRK